MRSFNYVFTIVDLTKAKDNMIKRQIRPWEIMSPKVLSLFDKIDRADFTFNPSLAYSDIALPILSDKNCAETMLEPKVEAKIIQAIPLNKNSEVLEVGTGSGFMTAMISNLVKSLDSIEINSQISKLAQARLYNFDNINLITADIFDYKLTKNYDAIIITGCLNFIPLDLKKSLKIGGNLLGFVKKSNNISEAILMNRLSENNWSSEVLFETFVPDLINRNQENEKNFIF